MAKTAAQIWADGQTVSKRDAARWGTAIEQAAAGGMYQATWPQLAALTGSFEGQRGYVSGPDTGNHDGGGAGTHQDPVTSATVANVGVYAWYSAGWRWLQADELAALGDAIDALSDTVDGKAADNAVVKLTGDQTIAGAKTFSTAPSVPDGSFAVAKVSGLQTALDAKATAAGLSSETAARVAADETLSDAIDAKAADNAVVKLTGDQTIAGAKTFSTAPSVPDGSFAVAKVSGLQTALDAKATTAGLASETAARVAADEALSDAIDALSYTVDGKAADNAVVKLTGDQTIAGSKTFSTAPSVPDGSFAVAKVSGLQTALDAKATAAGLSSETAARVAADETLSDAIDAKAADNAVVKLTGDQTIAGAKTFSTAPSVPDGSFAVAKVSGLQTALDAKATTAGLASETAARVAADEALSDAIDALSDTVDGKAADNAVVKLTGDQTIAGSKTFSTAPSVPDGSFAVAKVSGLQTALDAKAPAAGLSSETAARVAADEALSDALDAEATARAGADAALTQAIADEASARAADIIQLNATKAAAADLDAIEEEVAAARGSADTLADAIAGGGSLSTPLMQHPGEVVSLFTESLAGGDAVHLAPLKVDLVVANDEGLAVTMVDRAIVSMRQMLRVLPGRTYVASFAVRRVVDTDDPADDNLRLALACYGSNRNRLTGPSALRVVRDYSELSVADGRQVHTVTVSRAGAADVLLPDGCRYVRPYVQQYGQGGTTSHVEFIGWQDVTDLVSSVGLQPDAYGLLAERDDYDDEAERFVFVATDDDELNAYIRQGAAGSWVGPFALRGTAGPPGAIVEIDLLFDDKDEMQAAAALYAPNRGAQLYISPFHPDNGRYRKVGDIGTGSFVFNRPLGDEEVLQRLDGLEDGLADEVSARAAADDDLSDGLDAERLRAMQAEADVVADFPETPSAPLVNGGLWPVLQSRDGAALVSHDVLAERSTLRFHASTPDIPAGDAAVSGGMIPTIIERGTGTAALWIDVDGTPHWGSRPLLSRGDRIGRANILPLFVDPSTGTILAWIDKATGALHVARVVETGHSRPIRRGVAGGIENADGRVVIGATADGAAALFGEALLPFAYVAEDGNGTSQLFVDHRDTSRQLTFGTEDVIAGRCFAPGYARYVVADAVDGRTSRVATFDGELLALPEATNVSTFLPFYGQSNSQGVIDENGRVYTTLTPIPGRMFMFNGGVLVREAFDVMGGGGTTPPAAIDPSRITSLVAAVEAEKHELQQETSSSSAAVAMLERGYNRDRRVTIAAMGVGSASYPQLKKGTQPWGDLLGCVEAFATIESGASRTPSMPYLVWDHGETLAGADQATYAGYLDELSTDLRTDCAAHIDDADGVIVVMRQVSGGSSVNVAGLAQLERAVAEPDKFICYGPCYDLPYSGPNHFTSLGHRQKGDRAGKFISRHLRGEPTLPLYVKAVSRHGLRFRLDFDPVFPIVYDGVNVADPGGAGVRILDGSTAIDCRFMGIEDGRYALFRMASAPSGGSPLVQVACHGYDAIENTKGPLYGLRSCLRDTDPYTSPIDGRPSWNRACHQQIALPA